MVPSTNRLSRLRLALLAGTIALWPVVADAQQAKQNGVLRIGASGTLAPATPGATGTGELVAVQEFIKEETGLTNEIIREKDWRTMADKMAKGDLKIGVFNGIEYAWAVKEYPGLKPLALAVNVHRYPKAVVVTRKEDPATNFAGLQGHSLVLHEYGPPFLQLFAQRESKANGKDLQTFFSKITKQAQAEDCLDDVVDGVAGATVVDDATLDAYKQKKPGRFGRLKEVAQSQPFPPVVIAHYDQLLDEPTLMRFTVGLLGVAVKPKGREILTSFKLTAFEVVPHDFDKVLAAAREAYPPPAK